MKSLRKRHEYLVSSMEEQMLKLSFLEILVRGLPEAFIMILATHAFANKKLDKKEYLTSSLVMALVVYLVRLLPINYGVHTILNVFVLIFLTFNINKIDLIVGIKSSILVLMLLFVCEGFNIWFIQNILHRDLSVLYTSSADRIILGIPSTILFAVIVIVYYLILSKKRKLR